MDLWRVNLSPPLPAGISHLSGSIARRVSSRYGVEEGLHRISIDMVDLHPPPPLHVDEAASDEGAEVVTDHALLLPEGIGELGHAHRPLQQLLQYCEPGGIRHGGEEEVTGLAQPPLHGAPLDD